MIKIKFLKYYLGAFLLIMGVVACNSPYSYKKKGYFNIEFPKKEYRQFDQPGYPYTFEYPVYATIVKDSTFFQDRAEDWWINIEIPRFNGRIYISYKPISDHVEMDSLAEDSHKMAYKQHTTISSGITDSFMRTPNGLEGIYYSLKGNTATANQFFVTDSTKNFLRGALYFDAAPNEDSLSIVNDFVKQDLHRLINTLRWK